jgi:hypothetical protein
VHNANIEYANFPASIPLASRQDSGTVPDPVRNDFPRDKRQYQKKTFVIGAFSMRRCKWAPISFAMSVRLSVRMQLKNDLRYFHGILYWELLLKFFLMHSNFD